MGCHYFFLSFALFCFAGSLITAIVYCYRLGAKEQIYTFISRGFSVSSWDFVLAFANNLFLSIFQKSKLLSFSSALTYEFVCQRQ